MMSGWRSPASQLLSGLAATPVSQSLLQASRRHPKRHRVPAGRCRRLPLPVLALQSTRR
jgi:hypothetical protein